MKRRQLLFVLFIIMLLTACGRPSEEQVRKKMQQELYEEYGEEFVVDRIGMRSANGVKFYQARIYPKSIMGTEKEDDSYYYSTASVDLDRFKKASSVGNSYGTIKMNDEVEKYLLPKAKELFGEKIRIKVDVEYKIKDGDFFTQYLVAGFEEKRKEVLKNPDIQRFELILYLYLFDRIDSEEEKEERREQIFEFIQYLKVEGLFEYTRIYMTVSDERVLTNSYREYREKQDYVKTEVLKVGDLTFNVPNLEFRKEMIKVLTKELKEMTEEELIRNMNKIRKNEIGGLAKEGIIGNSLQYHQRIESKGFLQINNNYDRLNNIEKERVNYKNKEDVNLIYIDRYIFAE